MTTKTETPFSEVFRGAVQRSGKTLAQIVDELEREGSTISQASLSYWQSGRSVPRRQSSVRTLTLLERILDVPRGTLLDAASDGASRSFALTPETGATFENTSRGMIVPDASHAVPDDGDAASIDWSHEVERKAMRVNISISEGGHLMEVTSLCIVALTGIKAPVFHVGNVWSEGDPLPELTEIVGGQAGRSFVHEDEHYVLREIRLPRGFATGELRQVGWTVRRESAERITRTPHRWFAQPLGAYALTLDFGTVVPRYVEWVQIQRVEENGFTKRVETSRQLPVVGGIARLTLEDVHDCTAYVRWEW